MTGPDLSTYVRNNASSDSALSVSGIRRLSASGSLIHTTGGTSSRQWLQGGSAMAGKPASANVLIDRDGAQWDLCRHDRFPYHAGVSYFYHDGVNLGDEVSEILYGIELESHDDQLITFEQYDSCASAIVLAGVEWRWRWPYIILGHYAVARPLGRRSDPVGFDWGALMGRLYVRALAAGVPGLIVP